MRACYKQKMLTAVFNWKTSCSHTVCKTVNEKAIFIASTLSLLFEVTWNVLCNDIIRPSRNFCAKNATNHISNMTVVVLCFNQPYKRCFFIFDLLCIKILYNFLSTFKVSIEWFTSFAFNKTKRWCFLKWTLTFIYSSTRMKSFKVSWEQLHTTQNAVQRMSNTSLKICHILDTYVVITKNEIKAMLARLVFWILFSFYLLGFCHNNCWSYYQS